MTHEVEAAVEQITGLSAQDRRTIDAQLVHDTYWARRRARLRYLGRLPVPHPPASAFRLVDRVSNRDAAR